VNGRLTFVYTTVGEAFQFGHHPIPTNPIDRAFAEKFASIAEDLLTKGKINARPREVGPDGLDGVFDGLGLLKEGKVSGEKLVYKSFQTGEQKLSFFNLDK
jgi:hypothetical protein